MSLAGGRAEKRREDGMGSVLGGGSVDMKHSRDGCKYHT